MVWSGAAGAAGAEVPRTKLMAIFARKMWWERMVRDFDTQMNVSKFRGFSFNLLVEPQARWIF